MVVFSGVRHGPQRACYQVATMRLWWHAVNLQQKGLSQVNHQLGNDWRVTPATGPNYETYDPFDSKKNALFRDQESFLLAKTYQNVDVNTIDPHVLS